MSQNPPSRCAPSIAAPLDLLIEMTCTRERVMIDSALLAALSDTDGVQEVRLCLTRDLKPRRCGADVIRDCRLKDAILHPLR